MGERYDYTPNPRVKGWILTLQKEPSLTTTGKGLRRQTRPQGLLQTGPLKRPKTEVPRLSSQVVEYNKNWKKTLKWPSLKDFVNKIYTTSVRWNLV